MRLASQDNLECFVVIITTGFAACHCKILLSSEEKRLFFVAASAVPTLTSVATDAGNKLGGMAVPNC
jgi:hypothetical protein